MGHRTGIVLLFAGLLPLFAALASADPGVPGASSRGAASESLTTVWLSRSDLVQRALLAMNEGESAEVIVLAEAALALPLEPIDRLAALNALCVAHTVRGAPERAMRHCDDVVRESGSDWRALNNRGNALLRLGRKDEAVHDYRRALFSLIGLGRTAQVQHYGSAELSDGYSTVMANLELARRDDAPDLRLAASPAPDVSH